MADSGNTDLVAVMVGRANLDQQELASLSSLYAACKGILAQDAGTTTSMFQVRKLT
jgi:hypothetical protein